jgi:hypothetical protein
VTHPLFYFILITFGSNLFESNRNQRTFGFSFLEIIEILKILLVFWKFCLGFSNFQFRFIAIFQNQVTSDSGVSNPQSTANFRKEVAKNQQF